VTDFVVGFILKFNRLPNKPHFGEAQDEIDCSVMLSHLQIHLHLRQNDRDLPMCFSGGSNADFNVLARAAYERFSDHAAAGVAYHF